MLKVRGKKFALTLISQDKMHAPVIVWIATLLFGKTIREELFEVSAVFGTLFSKEHDALCGSHRFKPSDMKFFSFVQF